MFHRSELATRHDTCQKKIRYIRRRDARQAKTRMRNKKNQMIYKCNLGPHFHLSSRDKETN